VNISGVTFDIRSQPLEADKIEDYNKTLGLLRRATVYVRVHAKQVHEFVRSLSRSQFEDKYSHLFRISSHPQVIHTSYSFEIFFRNNSLPTVSPQPFLGIFDLLEEGSPSSIYLASLLICCTLDRLLANVGRHYQRCTPGPLGTGKQRMREAGAGEQGGRGQRRRTCLRGKKMEIRKGRKLDTH
jgi:hypothetical protein